MEADEAHHPQKELFKVKIQQMLTACKAKQQTLEKLPESFIAFLKERGVDQKELTTTIPRYVRSKPQANLSTQQLAEQLHITKEEIVQVEPHFWAVNPDIKINQCQLYQEGLLYGMDYSSSIPVKCLSVKPQSRVLELCCAPGNKSMLIADSHKGVKITGVEISINRANIMKNLVKKYRLNEQIEVITADGLKYDSPDHFDRILVDAQCTHEGSLKHIQKFFKQETLQKGAPKAEIKRTKQQQKQFKQNNSNPYTSAINSTNQWTQQDFEERFLDEFKLTQLNKLQYGLLENGFRLLKDGGIIVYSTCSFDQQQNQDIVREFLKQHQQAQLLDATDELVTPIDWQQGTLKGTIRLLPSVSFCGGMFVAKILKKPTDPKHE